MAVVAVSTLEKYHQFYDLLEGGVLMVMADGSEQVVFANKGILKLYDCGSEQDFLALCNSSFRNLMSEADYHPLAEISEDSLEHFHLSFHFRTKAGHYRKAEGTGWVNDTAFGPTYVMQLFSAEQIAEDRKADSNTGLPGMHDFFAEALRLAKVKKEDGTLTDLCPVSFDITNFREYNRIHGMHQGDLCLHRIADELKSAFPGALIGHLSADRFVGLLPADSLEGRLEHVCSEVNQYINDDGILMKAGIFRVSEKSSADEIRHAFDKAKTACDSIKNDGNRTVIVYEPSMGESISKKLHILRHFGEALQNKYIKVYFQPVIRTMTGKVCGFEALARWEDPELGMISPGIFVPILEEAQLINRLDRFVLERVLGLLHDRQENGLPLIPVSFNLSGYDFEVADPFQSIEALVKRYQVPRRLLRIEITERVMIRNRYSMISTIQRFQKAGYQVWMDDFGSEYSSLNSLHYFHFDEIKIDMGFFSHFDERSRQIITSVVVMAKMLGVQTVAEGVETAEQVEFLKTIGCGRIQGFYFGAPMPYDDCLEFLYRRRIPLEKDEGPLLDAAENVNLATESPTAIFWYDGRNITLLSENDAYRREMRSTGTQGMDEANLNLHSMSYPLRNKFFSFLSKVRKSGGVTEYLVYVDNGQYMKVSARWIAGGEKLWIGEAKIYNISAMTEIRETEMLDAVLRNIYQLYDGIYYLERGKDEIRVIQCDHPKVRTDEVFHSIMKSFASFADELIYPDDRSRFLSFINPDHLENGTEFTEGADSSDLFRVRREDGTYRWTVFRALVIYKSRTKNILICEQQDLWEKKLDRRSLFPVFLRSFNEGTEESSKLKGESEESELFRALKSYSGFRFFWKDRGRRFLGASNAFLEYTGIPDERDLKGKSVDEVGWRIDSSDAERAESYVLHTGECGVETTEQALVGASPHPVSVRWVPWYREKQIAGVIGAVVDLGDLEEERKLGMMDRETGLLNFRGLIEASLIYADQYRAKEIPYTGMLIDVPAFAEIQKDDTEKAGKILKEIVRFLTELPDLKWTVGRIGLCCFLCFSQKDTDSIDRAMQLLSQKLNQIQSRYAVLTEMKMVCATAVSAEAKSVDEMLQILIQRLTSVENHVLGENRYTEKHIVINREALDDVPERVIISDPNTYELLYLNHAARRDLKIAPNESLKGRKCFSVLEEFGSPCSDCLNMLLTRNHIQATTHICRRNGDRFLIRACLIPWEDRNLRLTIAFNMEEYAKTLVKNHELIYQEMQANDAITLGMSEDDPDQGIAKTIACISRNLKPDRFLIFEERDDNTVSATYEWTAKGVLPMKEELQSLPRASFRALYQGFNSHHVVMVENMEVFQKDNPDFSLHVHGVRSFVSGQLMLPDRTEGFTMVINPSNETFRVASLLLSTLTDFIAALIRNRNSLRKLEEQSMKDQLTGIGNRWALERRIREWEGDGTIGVISIDLNGLKNTNDSDGHHAGDMLICETAQILSDCAGEPCVFRTGGDEFVVVTEDIREGDIAHLAESIRNRAKKNGISLAAGYACCEGVVTDFDALLTKADLNMYKDKGHSFRRRREDRP